MSNCVLIDTVDWLGAGVVSIGDTGFGVLGSSIPSTGTNGPGYAYSDISLPADANTEICGRITARPTRGTLVAYEDTSFVYTANSDGADSFAYQLYKAGIPFGSPITQTLQVGGANGTANSASLTGTSSLTPGGATGTGSASVSGASLLGTSTIASGTASGTSSSAQTGTSTITVPASRTAVFAARSRVVVFNGPGPVTLSKVSADKLYFVGDFSKDLNDGATTAASIAYVAVGVAVIEAPTLQGALGVVKLGALDITPGAVNSLTFRVTCANNEVFDRTIILTPLDDRSQAFGKDPDDHRFYAFDVSAEVALSGSPVSSVAAPTVNGVTALAAPVIQGNRAIVLLGGLDLTDGAINSCMLTITLTNTEVINRTAYFSRQDH